MDEDLDLVAGGLRDSVTADTHFEQDIAQLGLGRADRGHGDARLDSEVGSDNPDLSRSVIASLNLRWCHIWGTARLGRRLRCERWAFPHASESVQARIVRLIPATARDIGVGQAHTHHSTSVYSDFTSICFVSAG